MGVLLQCETESEAVRRKIIRAFKAIHGQSGSRPVAVFEHGQWWVTHEDRYHNSTTYSVVDAVGERTADGFGFEEV